MFLKNKKDIEKKNLKNLSKYISSTLRRGFSEEEIKNALLLQDWPEGMINQEMSKAKDILTNHDKKEKIIEPIKKKPTFKFGSILKLKTILKEIKESEELSKIKNKIRRGGIMPKKITAEQAKSFLRQLEPERSFWVNNGSVLNNLEELSSELRSIEPEKFSHHVNKERNDFATWINEVIGDEVLARNLSKAKTQKTLIKHLDKRLTYLKKIVE